MAGLERDLNILPTQYNGYGYNLLLTAFYVSQSVTVCSFPLSKVLRQIAYVVFEPFGNLRKLSVFSRTKHDLTLDTVCKKFGPGKFLPALVFGFGISSFAVAFCHNFGAAFACRFLLGVFESAFFPGKFRLPH